MLVLNKISRALFFVVLLLFLSCENKKEQLNEIYKFSDVKLPENSTILIYYDDLEGDLSFKVQIEKKELNAFLKANHFQKIDLLNIVENNYKLYINRIENSFIPVEKIYGKDLYIFTNNKCTIVINCETSELWGLINY